MFSPHCAQRDSRVLSDHQHVDRIARQELARQVRWLLVLQVNTFQIRVSYDSLVFLGTSISF